MPQMYPMLWFNLFIMFLMGMVLILVIQYFLMPYTKLNLNMDIYYNKEKIWSW